MQNRHRAVIRALPIVASALLLVGCPKQPGLGMAAAPAPTAPASVAPPASSAAPGAPARQMPAPATPALPASTPPPTPATGSPSGQPRTNEFAATDHLRDIHFDFDKYEIRPGDAAILDANAAWLNTNTDLVLIEGHCDERGTAEYNLALGDRRAKATMRYLVGRGVRASRMTTVSFGKERPVCQEHNQRCWAENRRAHALVKPG
jgi:peptidoglycan-associated lipoprotein